MGARARPAREAGALPARGRPLLPLQDARRAAGALQWWVEMDRARPAGDRCRPRTSASVSRRSASRASASTGWRTSGPGASRARSGGATASPCWYCPDGHVTVGEDAPAACAECGSAELRQDEDVLDTWFSSALYPFATLGWPEETPELERYYPGDVLTTARDIIFLWVARMIFAGDELMGEDPFHDVVIHSYLANPDGSRMGRTAGTAVEPEDVLEPYGADATRYGLLKVTSSQDPTLLVRLDRGGTQARDQALERLAPDPPELGRRFADAAAPRRLEERWILARLDAGRAEARGLLRALRLRRRGQAPVPPDIRRLLRLVRRGDQAAPVCRGRGRARNRAGRARAAAEAPPPGDATCHRGDLVAPSCVVRRG